MNTINIELLKASSACNKSLLEMLRLQCPAVIKSRHMYQFNFVNPSGARYPLARVNGKEYVGLSQIQEMLESLAAPPKRRQPVQSFDIRDYGMSVMNVPDEPEDPLVGSRKAGPQDQPSAIQEPEVQQQQTQQQPQIRQPARPINGREQVREQMYDSDIGHSFKQCRITAPDREAMDDDMRMENYYAAQQETIIPF